MTIAALFTLAMISVAQSKVTVDNDNFSVIFRDLESKGAYLFYPGDRLEKPRFLGNISKSKYDTLGLANKYADHGSKYASDSIWNKYGSFGGKYSQRSPWNKYATGALEILYKEGTKTYIVAYLTANNAYIGQPGVTTIDPKYLAYYLDRPEDIPD